MGLIIATFPMDLLGHYPPQAYRTVMLVTAVGTLITFIAYLPLTRARSGASLSA